MGDMKLRLRRMVWCFLLSAAAGLAAGTARAQCTVLDHRDPNVSCYILVQPIDVCSSAGTACAPFNTQSSFGNPLTQTASTNRIGFFDPNTGADITRGLLNQIGIDLVYTSLPSGQVGVSGGQNIRKFNSPSTKSFQALNVTQGATCTGSIAPTSPVSNPPTGTLKITSCSSGLPSVSDTLSAGSAIKTGTVITAIGSDVVASGAGTYTVNISQTVSSRTITATSSKFQSQDFLNLSYQPQISRGAQPPNPSFPTVPLGTPSTVYNLLFVNTLNPPASQTGGQLNGFTYLGNNGTVIGANTFFPPAGVPLPVGVIAHEIVHGLGADHTSLAAGPWTAPTNLDGSYAAPAGVVLPVPAHPLVGQCDPSYPACAANLMTIGALRTEPSLACALAPSVLAGGNPPSACLTTVGGSVIQSPGLYAGGAVQLTLETEQNQTFLPKSQQTQVLTSGLLYPPPVPATVTTGFLQPIPHETTKAQAETGGSSADRAIFDLSRPVGGKPGETLLAWVLTLPQEQTFARRGGFDIVSQSRKDLVQSVDYYPHAQNNRLMRNIAYQPGAEGNSDDPSTGTAGPGLCASANAECLIVKFQSPGLGAHDTIKFSESILSGGAPITNDDLCKAKITYLFSDGYATTSNFGPCPAKALPLIASSWRPDLTVPPQVVKSNVLLAALQSQAATVTGSAYLNNPASGNAVIGFSHGAPDVTFSVPSPNPACPGGTTLCFNYAGTTLRGFLASGGVDPATIVENTPGALDLTYNPAEGNGTVFEFTGTVTVTNPQSFDVAHDDGLQLKIGNALVVNEPGPTSSVTTHVTYTGPSGTFPFDLVYGECCGPPAALVVSRLLEPPVLACTPDPDNPTQCLNPLAEGLADANPAELPQPGKICGGTGTINRDVTVSALQNCVFTSPCEITGNVTINGGSFWSNCTVDGNITQFGGNLTLTSLANSSAHVVGNLQISGASAFAIGTGVAIDGNLQIQNLPANQPQPGTVCGTGVKGNLVVKNNLSPVWVGEKSTMPQNCPGNTITGNLQCTGNNPVPISGSNKVTGKNQCSG